jgi:hypothetical protein
LLQAEARAEFAEKTVKKLQKEVDRLEGMCISAFSLTNRRFCPVHHLLGAWLVAVVLLGWLEINISLFGKFVLRFLVDVSLTV